MRTLKLVAFVVAACLAIKSLFHPTTGRQRSSQITDRELRTIRDFMDARESVPRGTIFAVQKVDGNRLWVSRLEKAQRAEGWLEPIRRDLLVGRSKFLQQRGEAEPDASGLHHSWQALARER